MGKRIVGVLEAFADSGTEGIYWAVLDNSMTGYDALNVVKTGDYLFVEDGNHGIEWEGKVNLRTDINLEPFPFSNKGYTWQRVNHCTVHGLQDGVDPKTWFEWFVTSRPAVLIKHED